MGRRKGKKYTPASGYLTDKEPRREVVAAAPSRRLLVATSKRAPRMTFFRPSEKRDMSPKEFANSIIECVPCNGLLFCDTNFFSRPVDFAVWDAILTRKLAIPPLVWSELRPWISNPHHNQQISQLVNHAYRNGHDKVEFLQISNEFKTHGFEHYLTLLSYRKRRGVELHQQLQARLGRTPTEQEFKAECQTHCGDRGNRLAYKGWQDRSKRNLLADEELVVLAVLSAILRGVDVAILSRDLDVEEQFLKLLAFLQHDYSAMLVAEKYASNPAALQFEPGNWPPFAGHVQNDEMLVWKTDFATVQGLKPAEYKTVHLQSVIVGDHAANLKVTPLSFCAETGLEQLLAIKKRTRGLNTDKLAGRNCRLGSIRNTAHFAAVICRDRMVAIGPIYVPALDKRFATCVNETVAPTCR